MEAYIAQSDLVYYQSKGQGLSLMQHQSIVYFLLWTLQNKGAATVILQGQQDFLWSTI